MVCGMYVLSDGRKIGKVVLARCNGIGRDG